MRAVILDTGVANLSSLAFAVKRLGVEPVITREAAEIRAADRILLPGVGTARACTTARCTYGEEFTAAAAHENFMGVQFHPERSGRAGARLLANFLGIEP